MGVRTSFGGVQTCIRDRHKITGKPEKINTALTRRELVYADFGLHRAIWTEQGEKPEKPGGKDTHKEWLRGVLACERSLQKGMGEGLDWGKMRLYTTGTLFPHPRLFPPSSHLPFIPVWLRTASYREGV